MDVRGRARILRVNYRTSHQIRSQADRLLPDEVSDYRAAAAIVEAGPPYVVLDERMQVTHGHLSVASMHLAKGLEFRTVLVMACDDEVLPLPSRIDAVGDDADLDEVYDTGRHLLYVACTAIDLSIEI